MTIQDLSPMQEAKRRFNGECDPNRRQLMLLDRVEKLEAAIGTIAGRENKAVPEDKPKMSVEERMAKARSMRKK